MIKECTPLNMTEGKTLFNDTERAMSELWSISFLFNDTISEWYDNGRWI